jgi:hypothetical protein
VFLPVTDLKRLLKIHEGNIGKAEDAGDGILRIDAPNGTPVFVKESGGWAFAAQDKNLLASTPADPTALLGGLDKQYTVAAKVLVRNIPAEMRAMVIGEMNKGFEAQLSELEADSPEDRALIEGIGRRQMATIRQFIEETDEITVGWAIDSMAKSTFIDISMTATAGTNLARQFADAGAVKSAFSGFLMTDAAAALHFAGNMSQDDVDQLTGMIEAMTKKAMQAIDEDADLDDDAQRTAAKEILSSLFGVMRKTVESGKLDGGATLLLGEKKLTFVAGGHVANAGDLDGVFRRAVELAKDEPDFPGVKFDADKHGDVTFHTIKAPIPEGEQAREFFGEHVEVTIGIGRASAYVAVGNDGIATLKKVIDSSAAGAGQDLPPSQLYVALAPIMKFAASVDRENPVTAMLAASVDKIRGNDRVSITSSLIERGVRSRIQVDEGVLKLLGETFKTFSGAGAGAPPGAF